MVSRSLIVVVAILLVLGAFVPGAGAEPDAGHTSVTDLIGVATLVTVEPAGPARSPGIDGDRIIWEDNRNYRNTSNDVYLYNATSGDEIRLTSTAKSRNSPGISGNFVAWNEAANGSNEVILYNLANATASTIASGESPDVSGGRIVYQDYRNGNADIFLYTISTGSEIQISADPSDQILPSMSADIVVWEDNRNGTAEIFLYNLTTQEETLISRGTGEHRAPCVSGNYVVWEEWIDEYLSAIMLYDIATGNSSLITPEDSEPYQTAPKIEGNHVIWLEHGDGTSNVFMYDIGLHQVYRITDDSQVRIPPLGVSGNRIVWMGRPDQVFGIYLFTIGAEGSCPLADFSAGTTMGPPPLPVQFNDTSAGEPETWLWDFGDGSGSNTRNPNHTFTRNGTYTVRLTISTLACRDAITKQNFISVGAPPVADFSASPMEGVAPLAVQFSDLSAGDPDSWLWDFGDGNSFNGHNPLYTYAIPGVYTVTLTAGNKFGNGTVTKSKLVVVMSGQSESSTTVFDGLTIEARDGAQYAVCNTTQVAAFFNPNANSSLRIIPPDSTRLAEVILYSEEGTGFSFFDNTTIAGNLTRVKIISADMENDGFGEGIGGPAPVNFSFELDTYPLNGSISTTLWEGATPGDVTKIHEALLESGSSFSGILETGYTARLIRTNISGIGPATVIMGVNSSWKEKYAQQYGTITYPNGTIVKNGQTNYLNSTPMGAQVWVDGAVRGYTPMNLWLTPGRHYVTFKSDGYEEYQVVVTVKDDSVRVIRIGDDGSPELLNTTFLYSDSARNLDYYEAYSPNGTSTFVFSSLYHTGGPLPLLAALIKIIFPPPNSGSSSPPAPSPPASSTTYTSSQSPGPGYSNGNTGQTPVTVPQPTTPVKQPATPEVTGTASPPFQTPPAGETTPVQVPPVPTTTGSVPEMFPNLIRNIALVAVSVIFVSVLGFRWYRRGEQ